MNTPRFTPGRRVDDGSYEHRAGTAIHLLCEDDERNFLHVYGPNREADALLYQVAPEMYEALKAALTIIGHPDDAFTGHLQAVITKAEGRSL